MKNFNTIIMTTLFFCMPLFLSAEDKPGVLLGSYPYDQETVSEEMDVLLEEGYLPVGLEVTPGKEIAVLYTLHEDIDADRYILYQFEDVSKFEDEFSSLLSEGWLPMDISNTGESIYGLFIRSPYEIEGWRLTNSSLDEEDISETLADFREKGFSPWGISGIDDRLWFLLLDLEETEFEEFYVNFYTMEDEDLQDKLREDVQAGWTPWGLMKRSSALSVLYMQ